MIHMELRCADSIEPHSGVNNLHERCWSHDNNGCSVFTGDTIEEVLEGKREMEGYARVAGWKKERTGWVCPYCLENRPKGWKRKDENDDD